MPARVAGMRIHTPGGADRGEVGEHRLVPVERRLGGTEVAVVVGDVAGLVGYPRDREVVAVVGRTAPMTCQTSSVPMTPASASQVAQPTRKNRRHAPRCDSAVPDAALSQPTASIAARRSRPATAQHAERSSAARLSVVGVGDEPGVDVDARGQARLRSHLQIGEDAGDLRFLFGGQVPVAPGMPTKSAPTPSALAQMCSSLQAPERRPAAARPRRR